MPFSLFAILYSLPLAYSPSTSFIPLLKVRIVEKLKTGEYQDTFFPTIAISFYMFLDAFFLPLKAKWPKFAP